MCRSRFFYQNVELIVECDPGIVVACRPTQIAQVILNLLNNAYDAVSLLPEKWIRLTVTAVSAGAVEICITDSGHGVPTTILDKIMQPFFTTKEVGRGVGLGLSISQQIIDDHRGKLYLDASHPNTRFVVELPL